MSNIVPRGFNTDGVANDSDYAGNCVHEVFEVQAAKTPRSIALQYEDEEISFERLNVLANKVAKYLRERDVGVETCVGVCFEPSIDGIVAILGVLKSGGTYVALDPDAPSARIQVISDISGLRCILTSDQLINEIFFGDARAVSICDITDTIDSDIQEDINLRVHLDNIAYVLYTSGSTGDPKGVAASHRSILNGLAAPPFDAQSKTEVCCLNTPLSSGFSVSRLFLPLLCGVRLVIVSKDTRTDPIRLAKAMQSTKVTSAAFVSPFLSEIINCGPNVTSRLAGLSTVTVGGSMVTDDLVESFRRSFPQTTLLNGYGASEIGGAAIIWTISSDSSEPRTRIFDNTRVYVLDDDMNSVQCGMVGELYVSAPHLARGYWRRPDLTAERFLPNPFGQSGDRLFRTGDLCHVSIDGELKLLGRIDEQVKIRGFRVEIGEIELVLGRYERLQAAAVVAHGCDNGIELVAFVVVRQHETLSRNELRHYLLLHLPEQMVPSRFVTLERLPLTTSGKVDKRALQLPQRIGPTVLSDADGKDLHTALEIALIRIWSDVLSLDNIGVHDNFFELGGHSLLAARIASRIRDQLGLDIDVTTILTKATIRDLANIASSGLASL